MRLQFSNPAGLYDPRPNGYSHVACITGPGRLVCIAGQGGEDAAGQLSPDFATQVEQALDNLVTALSSVGAQVTDVAKLTVLVVDHSEQRLAVFGQALKRRWDGAMTPACTLVPVPRLALDRMLFEIEAMAALDV